MHPIRILRHASTHGPGYLAEYLQRRGIPYEVIALDSGQALPKHTDSTAALVLLGGPMGVRDEYAWLDEEREFTRRAFESGLPLLGHGFGAELIAESTGGRVVRNAVQRIGWFEVERTHNAVADEWLADLPEKLHIFAWHRWGFEYPGAAVPLLKSKWCPTEAFAQDNILATQGHIAMTADMMRSWIGAYSEQVAQPVHDVDMEDKLTINWEAVVQGADEIRLDLEHRLAELHRVADVLYGRWLQTFT